MPVKIWCRRCFTGCSSTARHTFTGDGPFRTWMYHLARNVLVDSARQTSRSAKQYDVQAYAERIGGGTLADESLHREEALAELAHDASVREGLVQSLTRQESPLVQVVLADVMVKLQEKRSLKPLRQMLLQRGINDLVKIKLEQTIKDLS